MLQVSQVMVEIQGGGGLKESHRLPEHSVNHESFQGCRCTYGSSEVVLSKSHRGLVRNLGTKLGNGIPLALDYGKLFLGVAQKRLWLNMA